MASLFSKQKNRSVVSLTTFILIMFSVYFSIKKVYSQPTLFGMTSSGGDSAGVIFGLPTGTGSFSQQTNFNKPAGTPFSQVIQATNGKLYGLLIDGGANHDGVLFEYDITTNSYTKKFDFYNVLYGSYPFGYLLQASNGKLYGMTEVGGTNNKGVLFEFNIATGVYTKKIDFNGTANGSVPYGSLMQASNGKLYGMTKHGGINDMGVLFEYDITTNTCIKKIDFNGVGNGESPCGSLVQATNGKLYGKTELGGVNTTGVLFEYDIATNTCIKKIDFNGSVNGQDSFGSLIQAANGKLYGMTEVDGIYNIGTLFEYDIATNIITKKVDFNGTNGKYPKSSLIQAVNGKLYGMTYEGGVNSNGVIFEYDISTGTYAKKIDFNGVAMGSYPSGAVIQASNGKLYGLAIGGVNNKGVLFEYDISTSTYTKKIDFNNIYNGVSPYGSLMQATNGKLYGTTSGGGTLYSGILNGVLFEYDINTGTYTNKYDFNVYNGSDPTGSLIQASNGKLYGMTSHGGPNDWGVLFVYDITTDTLIKILNFSGSASGIYPYGSLIQASNGKLYGMASGGGANSSGAIFEYDINTNTYTKKFDFGGANGSKPYGSLMQATNGKLYGMTKFGGSFSGGVLFEYDITTSTYTKKIEFTGSYSGMNPYGDIIQAANGKLYGMTSGGTFYAGTIFEYDIATGIFTKKIDFNNSIGSNPMGSLMKASNNKLYGMTSKGGANNMGVLFEYDITMNVYSKKIDFNGTNGKYPQYSNLIEVVIPCHATIASQTNVSCNGGNNGSAIVTVTGTTGAIMYNWSTPVGTGATANGLEAGSYTCTVTDTGGCSVTVSVIITQPPPLDSTIENNGIITANTAGASYQWIDCDNFNAIISGETGQSFSASSSGDYAVIVSENGCSDTSACVNVLILDINEHANSFNWSLYPNPNNGTFIIKSNFEGNYIIQNELGQTINSFLLDSNNNFTISISGLCNGIYFICGFNNNQIIRKKIVVIR